MPATIDILHATDHQRWNAVLREAGADDVYFSPDYLRANEIITGGRAECFVYRDGDGTILYPYLRRAIDASDLSDITAAYGFGGYVASSPAPDAGAFTAAFRDYCHETRVVSEFIRYHPLYENQCYPADASLQITDHQPVVVAELHADGGDFRDRIAKEARKKAHKAERNAVRVLVDEPWDYAEQFVELYGQRMREKEAATFYHFPPAFFATLRACLATRSALLVALHEGRMIGGLLLLQGRAFGYNYLSCSDHRFTHLGTNDILQLRALEWAASRGLERHLLGGGVNGEDSLFHFKAKFSPCRARFFVGRRVHLPEAYAELCEERRKRLGSEPGEFLARSWFPLYRIGG